MKTIIYIIFVSCCLFIISIKSSYAGYYLTTAKPSLVVRESPATSSKKICTIAPNTSVYVAEKTDKQDIINGRSGTWVKIYMGAGPCARSGADHGYGYVFGGFLKKEDRLSKDDVGLFFYNLAIKNGGDELLWMTYVPDNKYPKIEDVPYGTSVDLGNDCGIIPPVGDKEENYGGFDEYYKFSESAAKSKERAENYLIVLKARNKLNDETSEIYRKIKNDNDAVQSLVKRNLSIREKKAKALPLFIAISKNSYHLAKAANFNYEGGCGAGEEDSQDVKFKSEPRASIIRFITKFNYKLCKEINADPFLFNECDMWEDVLKDDSYALSGDYVIYARWDDGTIKKSKYSAVSTKPATLRIVK